MNMDQITKAIAPLVKLVQQETTAPLLAEMAAMKVTHAREMKETLAKLLAENRQLKNKLAKAIKQRDEWQYQARKYRKTLLEKAK